MIRICEEVSKCGAQWVLNPQLQLRRVALALLRASQPHAYSELRLVTALSITTMRASCIVESIYAHSIDPNENDHAFLDWKFQFQDHLHERSKAVAQGAIPQGRGFESHSRHIAVNAPAQQPIRGHVELQLRALSIDAQQARYKATSQSVKPGNLIHRCCYR